VELLEAGMNKANVDQTAEGVLSTEMPGVPFKMGEVGRMMGVSLFWWDMEGVPEGEDEDGKIKKEVEYSKLLA
jgi:hypothetical protein